MRRPTRELSRQWNQRLKASGFRDIEPEPGGQLSGGPAGVNTRDIAAKMALAEMKRRLFWDHRFESSAERDVWRLLVLEGKTCAQAAEALGMPRWKVESISKELNALCLSSLSRRSRSEPDGECLEQNPQKLARYLRNVDAETFLRLAPLLAISLEITRRSTTRR